MSHLLHYVCIALFLSACIHLPPTLPEMDALPLGDARVAQLTKQWRDAGFGKPEFFQIRSRYQPQSPASAGFKGMILLVARDKAWDRESVLEFSKHLPQRLDECAINSGEVLLVFADSPRQRSKGRTENMREWGASVPMSDRPLFIFTNSTGKAPDGRDSGGVTLQANSGDNHGKRFALIARHNPRGKNYQPEQTLAHELGHIIGLEHTAKLDENGRPNVDLMQPRGCLYCTFTPGQCRLLRSHPWN